MLDLVPFRRVGSPDLFKEMEELTRHFWEGFPLRDSTIGEDIDWAPRLDITETGKTVEVTAELPGIEKKDIDISLDGDLLVIKGEKKHETEEKGRCYHRVERRFGSFSRTVRLPYEVKTEKIDATFKDGILTVTLPKAKSETKKVTHVDVH